MTIVVFAIIVYAALYDLRFCKIPNYSVVAIIVVSLTQALFTSLGIFSLDSPSFVASVSGLLFSFIFSIILYQTGLFGAGDAKLLASLGAVFGLPHIFLVIATAISIAGILSLLRVACYGELFDLLKRWYQAIVYRVYQPPQMNSVASSAIPMGGAILLATLYCDFYLF